MSHGGVRDLLRLPDLVPAQCQHWEARGTRERKAGQTVSAPQGRAVLDLGTPRHEALSSGLPPPVPSPLTHEETGQGPGRQAQLHPQAPAGGDGTEAAAVLLACVPGWGWTKEGREMVLGRRRLGAAFLGQHRLGRLPRGAGLPASSMNRQLPQAKQGV